MAKKKKGKKAAQILIPEEYWHQPWVECVLEGTYSAFEKLLFVRVTSFDAEGSGITNAELMDSLGCSRSTAAQAITKLWRGGEFKVTGRNGHGRRIYAARNPNI